MARSLENKHVQDWANLALAILLFISPWVLGFSTERNPSVNAWISAIVIGTLSTTAEKAATIQISRIPNSIGCILDAP